MGDNHNNFPVHQATELEFTPRLAIAHCLEFISTSFIGLLLALASL